MKVDQETVASLARGHRTMFPRHRTRPVRNGMLRIVGYLCDGASEWEPCEVEWFIPVEVGVADNQEAEK